MDDRQRQQVMAKLRNEVLPLKVIEVNRRRRRLVLSQRDAQKEWQETRKEVLIDKLEEGDIVKGRVSGLRNFGAFIDLGGADGLIHISELAWHRVNHPREVLKVGDEVEVYVLGLDKDDQRIALSRKRLIQNPWETAEQRYQIGQLVEGMVTRIVTYGAFVEIEPGIEGLLHISQLSRETVEDANELIKEGETHLLRVVSVDAERQRIGLSLKSVTANEQIQWMAQREADAAETEAETEEEPISETEEPAAEVETEVIAEESEDAAEAETEAVIEEAEEAAETETEAVAEESEQTVEANGQEPEDAGSSTENEEDRPDAETETTEDSAESQEEPAESLEESAAA
jgi:small subunit ribosomal protein S1